MDDEEEREDRTETIQTRHEQIERREVPNGRSAIYSVYQKEVAKQQNEGRER